jgi:hypothetical protein
VLDQIVCPHEQKDGLQYQNTEHKTVGSQKLLLEPPISLLRSFCASNAVVNVNIDSESWDRQLSVDIGVKGYSRTSWKKYIFSERPVHHDAVVVDELL